MKRIKSFSVDHRQLKKGIYVSRTDGDILTLDVRMTEPNNEPAMDPKAAHTIEHIGATWLRNSEIARHVIYWGPMGCMTGFYLIVRDLDFEAAIPYVKEALSVVRDWEGPIPGAAPEECGNYTYMDLPKAKESAKHFLDAELEYEYHYLEGNEEAKQYFIKQLMKTAFLFKQCFINILITYVQYNLLKTKIY